MNQTMKIMMMMMPLKGTLFASLERFNSCWAQVKNKIISHSTNQVKKIRYCGRVLGKQRVKVSGLCDIPHAIYS